MKIGTQPLIKPEESGKAKLITPRLTLGESLKIIVLVVTLIGTGFASIYYTILDLKEPEVNNTVIHDTVMVHDTVFIKVENTPVTYVCQGICHGFEGFEER